MMDCASTCRFCLSTSRSLTEVSEEIVTICYTVLGIELKKIPASKVCRKCLKFLNEVQDFKVMCVENELRLEELMEVKEEPEPEMVVIKPEVLKYEPEDPRINALSEDGGFEWEDKKLTRILRKKKKPQVRQRKKRLDLHENGKLNDYSQCKVCHKMIMIKSMEIHMQKHEIGPCPICAREFSTTAMPLHILRHKNEYTVEEKEKYRKYYCELCNIFSVAIKQHKRRAHGEVGLVSCEICGKTMQREVLPNHMRIHDVPYACDLCGRTFVNKAHLRSHLEAIHLKIKRFFCQQCPDKGFRNHYLLKLHMRHYHEAPKFICSLCGKSCKDKATLEKHIEAVHTKSGNFKCQDCGARYNSQSALNYHVSTAHSCSVEKQNFGALCVKCACGQEFFSRASMRQHLDTDHVEEDGRYKCACGRYYLSRGKLNIHLDRYHKIPVVIHRSKAK